MRPHGTPPPPDCSDGAMRVSGREDAEALWRDGQDLAAALERQAEAEQDAAEQERLGDLADGLRGI